MSSSREKIYIYGKHALKEALLYKPKSVEKVFLSAAIDDKELRDLLAKAGIKPVALSGATMKKGATEDAAHQGVIALISLSEIMIPYEIFAQKLEPNPETALVLLDELNDPHNVGAVIRSAAAFGVGGVLIPQHNQAPITGAVVKVSAGMAFCIHIVAIGNVNDTLRNLKERGFWIYGLAGESAQPITNEKFDAPAVFVLGNESSGIRAKTREVCDVLLSIPIKPGCESLNVAAAAAVTFYEWSTHLNSKV